MSDLSNQRAIKWKGTPRPLTPGYESANFSTDSESNSVRKQEPWRPVPSAPRHRAATVCGWVTVPRSVVMATTLDKKHVDQLEHGGLTTVCDVINERKKRMEEIKKRNKNRIRSKTKTPPRKQLEKQQPQTDYYQKLLEENLTKVKELAKDIGKQVPERYSVVEPSECDDDYVEASTDRKSLSDLSNLEKSMDQWKHSFIRRSIESSSCTGELSPRKHDRPFTADSTLRSQSDKASEGTLLRPPPFENPTNNARKTTCQKLKYEWQKSREIRERLPGYPPRIVRNRPHEDHMKHPCNRKIMTPQTTWFPLSFSENKRGKLVEVSSDVYGFNSVAEYKELCATLQDGMAFIEQPINIGSTVEFKVLSTDRRKDLMYMAAYLGQDNNDDKNGNTEVPVNRLSPAATSNGWIFSDEITGLRRGVGVKVTLDALGRVKVVIEGKPPKVILQLLQPQPCYLAFFLGVGVTKVQLLGGHRQQMSLLRPTNAYEIVPGIKSDPNLPSPFFTYRPPNDKCSLCSNCDVTKEPLTSPYVCDHVTLCVSCRNRVECVLCSAPLCWFSCPVCDTRIQPY